MKTPLHKIKSRFGFTLIEVMVAVALFTIIMVIGTGSVLTVNATYKKTQTMRSVIDSLNFIMEDMARNIRLGSVFHCGVASSDYNQQTIELPSDCKVSSGSIAFEPFSGASDNPDDQLIYGITKDSASNPNAILKSRDGGRTFVVLTPPEVKIDPLRSGFIVEGSLPDDKTQPHIIIRLSGVVKYKNLTSSFNIQTTVTERLIDG